MHYINIMRKVIPLVLLFIGISLFNLQAQTDEELVIQAVQKFFDAMADKDTAVMKEILLMDGQLYSVRRENEEMKIRRTTHWDYVNGLAKVQDEYLETMNSPMIHIHGNIAVVWTNYNFYLNNEFSHTGVDAFSLIKTKTGWKIAGTIYTVERKDE